MVGVEEVLLGVVVRGGRNDDIVGILICLFSIEGGPQIQFFFGQIFFYVIILDWGDAIVDLLDFLGNDIHGCDVVVLCQQSGDTHTDIAGTCYCNFHIYRF